MSDLRSACIEAMAEACIEAMAEALYGDLRVGHNPETIYQLGARHALDALLGVLEEHADEWAALQRALCRDSPEECFCVNWVAVPSLLAVLREDT